MKLSNVPLKKNKKNYSFNGTKKEKKKKKNNIQICRESVLVEG